MALAYFHIIHAFFQRSVDPWYPGRMAGLTLVLAGWTPMSTRTEVEGWGPGSSHPLWAKLGAWSAFGTTTNATRTTRRTDVKSIRKTSTAGKNGGSIVCSGYYALLMGRGNLKQVRLDNDASLAIFNGQTLVETTGRAESL